MNISEATSTDRDNPMRRKNRPTFATVTPDPAIQEDQVDYNLPRISPEELAALPPEESNTYKGIMKQTLEYEPEASHVDFCKRLLTEQLPKLSNREVKGSALDHIHSLVKQLPPSDQKNLLKDSIWKTVAKMHEAP